MARSTGVDQLEERVIRAAHAALARNRFVSPVDVLVGLGWLPQTRLDDWRQGRVDALETVVSVNLSKVSRSMAVFRRWAREEGLSPSETAYIARTRDRRPLRFSQSGDPEIERAYRTHWVSPELSERKQERLRERLSRPPDLVVIDPLKDWTCTACGEENGGGTFLLMEEPGPVCLRCADLDHLVFLPSGDTSGDPPSEESKPAGGGGRAVQHVEAPIRAAGDHVRGGRPRAGRGGLPRRRGRPGSSAGSGGGSAAFVG